MLDQIELAKRQEAKNQEVRMRGIVHHVDLTVRDLVASFALYMPC